MTPRLLFSPMGLRVANRATCRRSRVHKSFHEMGVRHVQLEPMVDVD